MCFIFSFVPATVWTVVGYFVLYSTTRTEDGIRKFGRILAVWVFILAACFPLMGAYVSITDKCIITSILKFIAQQ